jgi:hypothetical protein
MRGSGRAPRLSYPVRRVDVRAEPHKLRDHGRAGPRAHRLVHERCLGLPISLDTDRALLPCAPAVPCRWNSPTPAASRARARCRGARPQRRRAVLLAGAAGIVVFVIEEQNARGDAGRDTHLRNQ